MIHKEELFKQIGKRVAWHRKETGLTQQMLADAMNRSRSTISRIEEGRYNHNIPLSTLVDIANTLRLPISVFFEDY